MGNEDFTGAHLFQLNLLIFLTLPATDGKFSPIFWESGYQIESISPTLTLPLPLIQKAKENNIKIKPAVSPEIVFSNNSKKLFIIVECKKTSFSIASSNSEQARTYLLLSGNLIRDSLGKSVRDNWGSVLLYLVGENHREGMIGTLKQLSAELASMGAFPIPHTVLEIKRETDGIYLRISDEENKLNITKVKDNGSNKIKVLHLEKGDDPRPLYLIPIDPSVGMDSYGKTVMEERTRLSVASNLGRKVGGEFDFIIDEMLASVISVWDLWEDSNSKRKIRGWVKTYITNILNILKSNYFLNYQYASGAFHIESLDEENANKIRRYLESADFRKGKLELPVGEDGQLKLFELEGDL